MTTIPEALRSAAIFEFQSEPDSFQRYAIAKLRRVCEIEKQRDELLEALEDLKRQYSLYPNCYCDWSKARAAIAKAERTTT